MKEQIKGFLEITVGTLLGAETIKNIGSIGSGAFNTFKGPTQSLVSIGIFGNAASSVKGFFKK